jgi:hypothetical protein
VHGLDFFTLHKGCKLLTVVIQICHPFHVDMVITEIQLLNAHNSSLENDEFPLVKVKFKFLHNISHYNNNKFAFHMHMFTSFVLSLNKLNIIIHSNIKFMVIAYNQNIHFIIHCKKLQIQYYNSFHHNLILKKIHTKDEHRIHCKSLCFSILLNTWIQITTWSHVFIKEKCKTTLQICAISKHSLWFSTTNTSKSYFSLKLPMSSSSLSFKLQNFPLLNYPSHIIMIQTTRIQNSN